MMLFRFRLFSALALVVLLGALAPANVLADTIDFEGADPVASGEFLIDGDGPFDTSDFFGLLTSIAFGWCAQDCGEGEAPPQVVTLRRADNAPFSLQQMDAAPLFNADDDNPIVVTGFLSGGGTVTQDLVLSNTANEFDTYTLSGFSSVVRVEFTKLDTAPDLQDAAIDNLVVDSATAAAASVPAIDGRGVVALLLVFLSGALMMRRRMF